VTLKGTVHYGPGGAKVFKIDGAEVDAETFHRHFPSRIKDLLAQGKVGRKQANVVVGGLQTTGWPWVSEALAVGKGQVEEANARARRHGIAVDYDGDGFAHVRTREARVQLMKLEGVFDKQGGYGDG
jgi:hypothetical protein